MAEDEESDKEKETPDTPAEDKPDAEKKPTAIEAATALADRIDAGNKKAEEILERQEKLHAEQMLGGSSDAGQAPPKKEKMTDAEYKDKVMAGDIPNKDD